MSSSSETGKVCSLEDKKDEQGEEIPEEVAMETEERPVDIIGKLVHVMYLLTKCISDSMVYMYLLPLYY